MPMDTRNEGGHVPLAIHNSGKSFGNRWWLRSQHLMKEPSTTSKAREWNQEGMWLGAFLPFIISNEESAHLKEIDKM